MFNQGMIIPPSIRVTISERVALWNSPSSL
jgi:hypothetical protein